MRDGACPAAPTISGFAQTLSYSSVSAEAVLSETVGDGEPHSGSRPYWSCHAQH